MNALVVSSKRPAPPDKDLEVIVQDLENLQIGRPYDANLLKDLYVKHPRLMEPVDHTLIDTFAHSGALIPLPKIAWGEIDVHAMFTNGGVPDLFQYLHFLKTLGRKWGSYELFSYANFHRYYTLWTTEATADIAILFMHHEGLRGFSPEVMLYTRVLGSAF
jgi:hypothetical protein